ncbi:MAG: hypothetical protein NWE78_03180 [Candidatus Bathyarchaeota archaeon]|nr:hypothetical protein [Candidatus Bathyarchaeota archaeon]
MDLVAILINIVVSTLIVAPFLWISGRSLAGKDKAKFLDAIWIVLLGTVINAAVTTFVPGLVALVIVFIVWLGLIKHFFDCGWIMAFAIALVAVIIAAVVLFILGIILALIGFAIVLTWI